MLTLNIERLKNLLCLRLRKQRQLQPKTRPENTIGHSMLSLGVSMARDSSFWRNAMLISLLNTMIFSYYSLAPFLFEQFGWDSRAFGWTGFWCL